VNKKIQIVHTIQYCRDCGHETEHVGPIGYPKICTGRSVRKPLGPCVAATEKSQHEKFVAECELKVAQSIEMGAMWTNVHIAPAVFYTRFLRYTYSHDMVFHSTGRAFLVGLCEHRGSLSDI